MHRFTEFVTEDYLEEKYGAMKGSIGSEATGLRHVSNYVFPYLSHDQRQHSLKNMALHMNPDTLTDENRKKYEKGAHGSKYKPDSHSTHELALAHKDSVTGNVYQPGTPIHITGVRHNAEGNIFAQTSNHGEVPLSKIAKPSELKKPVITKGGFDVENKLAKNLGTVAAGSTGTAYDYSYRGHEPGGIKGKARKIEEDKPYIRGESKQNKASMGLTVIKHDPQTKRWDFGHDKPHLAQVYQHAVHPQSGLPLLDHLNKHNSDGRLDSGFVTKAPKGSTRAYLAGLGVNSLHLHLTNKKKAIDHGTSYTIGDDNDLKGKSTLGHLANKDIDRLDNKIGLEKTTTGSIRIVHKPNYETFKEYANNSKHSPNDHRDLTNEEHAHHFRKAIDDHISSKNKYSLLPEIKPRQQVAKSEPKPKLLRKVMTKPVSQNVNVQKLASQARTNKAAAAGNDGTVGGYKF